MMFNINDAVYIINLRKSGTIIQVGTGIRYKGADPRDLFEGEYLVQTNEATIACDEIDLTKETT